MPKVAEISTVCLKLKKKNYKTQLFYAIESNCCRSVGWMSVGGDLDWCCFAHGLFFALISNETFHFVHRSSVIKLTWKSDSRIVDRSTYGESGSYFLMTTDFSSFECEECIIIEWQLISARVRVAKRTWNVKSVTYDSNCDYEYIILLLVYDSVQLLIK